LLEAVVKAELVIVELADVPSCDAFASMVMELLGEAPVKSTLSASAPLTLTDAEGR
jgi:hypothetical protein